jgi:ribosomal protein L37E
MSKFKVGDKVVVARPIITSSLEKGQILTVLDKGTQYCTGCGDEVVHVRNNKTTFCSQCGHKISGGMRRAEIFDLAEEKQDMNVRDVAKRILIDAILAFSREPSAGLANHTGLCRFILEHKYASLTSSPVSKIILKDMSSGRYHFGEDNTQRAIWNNDHLKPYRYERAEYCRKRLAELLEEDSCPAPPTCDKGEDPYQKFKDALKEGKIVQCMDSNLKNVMSDSRTHQLRWTATPRHYRIVEPPKYKVAYLYDNKEWRISICEYTDIKHFKARNSVSGQGPTHLLTGKEY